MYLLGPDGPVRVVKVEEAGVYDVHDITVEDDHSYVSCGVFSHNSCNDPNLQNIPTRNKPKAKIVKRQFVAKRGRLMLKRDFSAHEVRMWGVASGDPKIGDVFWNGMQVRLRYEMQRAIPKEKEKFWQDELSAADVHRQNVNLFYGTDPRKVDDATRGSVKAIIFGAVYGKGIKSLAKDIKDTEEKARELWKLIFRKKFRVGGDWLLRTQKRAARTLIAKNVLGGVRHLYGYLHTDSSVHAAMNRRGPNSIVQGPSSNVGYEGGYFTRRLIWNLYESRGVDLGYLQCNAVHDCVVGDTLISTARGLYRIDELSSGRTKQLTIDVHSRYGIERTSKWINRGVRPVRRLVTAAGTIVEGTDNHEILIMREGDHTWIKMGEVRKNDLLCIPLRRNTNIAKLSLGITKYAPPSWVPNGCTDARPRTERWIASSLKDVRIPNTMSPELAFILGLLISEGTLRERLLCIPNTNYALLERARDYFVHVFGVEPKLLLNRRATARTGNKQYVLVLASKSVLNYLAQIGVVGGKTLRGKTPSYYKQIPWSILRADCESQLAFMAAYVEGDGTVGRYGLTIATTSRSLSLQMQQLFIHNGFLAARTWRKSSGAGKGYCNERGEKRIAYHVTLNTAASRDFFDAARAYFVSKYREIKHGGSSQKLPLSFVQDVIRSRRLGKGYYLNDEGVRVKCAIHANRMRDKYIDARALTTPKGAHFLRELKVISESTWSRLVALMQLPYAYTPVVRIQKTGEKPVYDLSIALGGEPAYVANGIVCHNSTECECDIVNIPLVEYLAFHGYTTLVHRWMMKTFGVDLKVGFEMDSEIGGSLAALKKAPRHDMQVDAIAAGIEWGNSELGWGLDLDAYMRRVKHNASIMFEVRRAEIKEQLARGTRTNTKMNVNYDNALKLGLIFDAPPEKRREGSSAKSSRTKSTMRELEDS